MNLKTLANDTRLQVGFTLFLVWLLDIWHFRADPWLLNIIVYPLLSIALIGAIDLGLTWIRSRKIYLPTAPVVSGFLIGLILAPSEPAYVILAASILASLSKQFIATGIRRHIFNPAAFGIIGTYLIFGATVAWWGVSWGWYPIIIFLPLMIRILVKLKRLALPATFLGVYFVYLVLTTSVNSTAKTIVDPTVLFFVMVMLPEPITSPVARYYKYGFGVAVAFLAILISILTKLPEIFLPALLLANLGAFLIQRSIALGKRVQ